MPSDPTSSVTHTRVWIFLPLMDKTMALINTVIGDATEFFGGCTHSKVAYPSQFTGRWTNSLGQLGSDRNVILIISDVPEEAMNVFFKVVHKIKEEIEEIEEVASISYHQIDVLAGTD